MLCWTQNGEATSSEKSPYAQIIFSCTPVARKPKQTLNLNSNNKHTKNLAVQAMENIYASESALQFICILEKSMCFSRSLQRKFVLQTGKKICIITDLIRHRHIFISSKQLGTSWITAGHKVKKKMSRRTYRPGHKSRNSSQLVLQQRGQFSDCNEKSSFLFGLNTVKHATR